MLCQVDVRLLCRYAADLIPGTKALYAMRFLSALFTSQQTGVCDVVTF